MEAIIIIIDGSFGSDNTIKHTHCVLAGGRSLPCTWGSKRRTGWWRCREDLGLSLISQVRKLVPAGTERIIRGPQAAGSLLHWVSVTTSSGRLQEAFVKVKIKEQVRLILSFSSF